MVLFDPIFGICFLPVMTTVAERIHRKAEKDSEYAGDYFNLNSDAEHQKEKSEHPV